jgi:hypothetical protein
VNRLEKLRARVARRRRDGTVCPVCDQRVKEHRLTISSGTAHQLIEIYRRFGTDWFHLADFMLEDTSRSRATNQLRHWGIIETDGDRDDEGRRSGIWRITERGERFVRGDLRVPKYVYVYNGEVVGKEKSTRISIEDALRQKFDYAALMAG